MPDGADRAGEYAGRYRGAQSQARQARRPAQPPSTGSANSGEAHSRERSARPGDRVDNDTGPFNCYGFGLMAKPAAPGMRPPAEPYAELRHG